MSVAKKPVQYLPSQTDVKVVVVEYPDLVSGADVTASIQEAYGFDGLGLLVVQGVPNFEKLRQDLLPLSHKFANLSDEIKQKTTHEESFYSFGWSHGKEKMVGGQPDYSKGSYYNNPLYDRPFDDEQLVKKYPSFCHPNIWPTDDLPVLRPAFLAMGKLITDVGMLVATQCDNYVRKEIPTYPEFRLYNIIKNSKTHKARLLHYFPQTSQLEQVSVSSWCGWHNDHSSLTGLVPAMYINHNGEEVPNPDPNSGLYVISRNGKQVKVAVPKDHLAFQIGETAQIHSGGLLQATPHCVQAASGDKSAGISRETFAVFMEPQWDEKMDMPKGCKVESVVKGSATQYLPKGVPLLERRWKKETMNFGEFSEVTISSFY